MLIMSILVLYATMSILRDTRRALSHASVSGRNSLRDRVEAFSKRAQRTMFLSFSILASVSATVLTMAICDECTDYFWVVIPLLFFFGNCWVTRAHLISIAASRKMRAKLSQSQLQLIQLKRKLNEREAGMMMKNNYPEEQHHEGRDFRSSSQEVERRGLEDEQRMSQASSGELKSMMRDVIYESRFASSRQTASFVLRKDSKTTSSSSKSRHHHGQQQSGGGSNPRQQYHHHQQQQRRTTTSFSTSPSNSPNAGNSPLNAAITVDENEQHSFVSNFLLPLPTSSSSSSTAAIGSLKKLRFPTGAGRTMVSTSKRLVSQALAAMSAVVETDNEGTVIMTNIDGIVQSMAHPKPPTTHASSGGGVVGNGGNDNELSSSNPLFEPSQPQKYGGGENNNNLFRVKDEEEEEPPATDFAANQN